MLQLFPFPPRARSQHNSKKYRNKGFRMAIDEETHNLMVAMVEKRFKFGSGKRTAKENAAYMRYYRHQDSLTVVDGRLHHDGKMVNIVPSQPHNYQYNMSFDQDN